jgi:hypothetical protein
VAFDQNPTIVVVNPAMGNPVRAGMGWTIPAAGNPDVVPAVPAVIAINPNESPLRCRRAALNDGGRWANANHNLRK